MHTLLSRFMCIVSVHVWEYVGQCGARSDCTHSCSGTFVASNSHAQSFLHAFLFSIHFLFHSYTIAIHAITRDLLSMAANSKANDRERRHCRTQTFYSCVEGTVSVGLPE